MLITVHTRTRGDKKVGIKYFGCITAWKEGRKVKEIKGTILRDRWIDAMNDAKKLREKEEK